MRTIDVIGTCLLCLGFGALSLSRAADVPESPPSPEAFLAQGKGAEYLRLAKEFLDKNPQSERAPQVAWNLYQMVRLDYDANAWRSAGLRLLGDYPSSLQAQYLTASMPHHEGPMCQVVDGQGLRVVTRLAGLRPLG